MPADNTSPPDGFTILADNTEELSISYRSDGMGCLATFAVTFSLSLLYVIVTQTSAARQIAGMEPWSPITLALGLIALGYWNGFVLFRRYGIMSINVSPMELAIHQTLFIFSFTRRLPRESLKHLEQISDGDTTAEWGLRIVAKRKHRLLWKQPIEKSDWLGPRLAQRLGIEFRPRQIGPGK